MAEAEFNVIGAATVAKDAMAIDKLAADADAVAVAADALATEKLHADAEGSMHHDELVEEEAADDAMDRDEADTNFLSDSVWTDVAAINAHADAKCKVATKVQMGGISMTFIDSEGQANKVPRKHARALPSAGASSSHSDGLPEPPHLQMKRMTTPASYSISLELL